MRDWRNWLPPLLTALTVACLAVLPLRLSAIRDGRLSGAVHAEELGADSNFPAKPPELPGRVWLVAQMESWPDNLTVVEQELADEELERTVLRAQEALRTLWEAGILPEDPAPYFESVSAGQIYLRDQRDLASAAFLVMDTYESDSGAYLGLCLDGETNQVLGVNLATPQMQKEPADAAAVGELFLHRLGLEYGDVEDGGTFASFYLTEYPAVYRVYRTPYELRIWPDLDWRALEEIDAERSKMAYGVE